VTRSLTKFKIISPDINSVLVNHTSCGSFILNLNILIRSPTLLEALLPSSDQEHFTLFKPVLIQLRLPLSIGNSLSSPRLSDPELKRHVFFRCPCQEAPPALLRRNLDGRVRKAFHLSVLLF